MDRNAPNAPVSRPRLVTAPILAIAVIWAACGDPSETATPLLFRLPVDNTDGRLLFPIEIGVDHDPEGHGGIPYRCLSYDGKLSFPYCYDQHDGTDFILDGGFEAMDTVMAWVVAAADGVVIDAADGNYDRCHTDVATQEVTCDGHPIKANYVVLKHAGGYETGYWHLKSGSVQVAVGDQVSCGDRLGLIGSSGVSTTPHLHFQLTAPDGSAIDPYAGPNSQPRSYWVEQDGPHELPAETCAAR